jgi:hypothetical protein
MVKIHTGILSTTIKPILQEIVNLSEEEKYKYHVSLLEISSAQQTIKKIESCKHHEAQMTSEDVENMIYALLNTFRLKALQHAEDNTKWMEKYTEQINEHIKFLKEEEEYCEELLKENAALKEMLRAREKQIENLMLK